MNPEHLKRVLTFKRKKNKLPKMKTMENKYYSLEPVGSNRLTRIFQLILGILCFLVAIIWVILNISLVKSNGALWFTIIFLLGFGYYQINSGLGHAARFIEIGTDKIRLKKNSLLPVKEINKEEIEKIKIFPLNLIFFMKQGKTIILRFGTTFTDKIVPIKDGVISFAAVNRIPLEIKTEDF